MTITILSVSLAVAILFIAWLIAKGVNDTTRYIAAIAARDAKIQALKDENRDLAHKLVLAQSDYSVKETNLIDTVDHLKFEIYRKDLLLAQKWVASKR